MHPESIIASRRTQRLDLDDPALLEVRRAELRRKRFLYQIYEDWYRFILADLDDPSARILEMGSGAGFLKDLLPGLIHTDVVRLTDLSAVLDARRIPFATDSLRTIILINVLHHIPVVQDFFEEAGRCVAAGGQLLMIEPWNTPWSRLIYRTLHHETFEPGTESWDISGKGHMSGANGALPWILFDRDRARFQDQFPQWEISEVRPFMPFAYLLSGGFSTRFSLPAGSYPLVRAFEQMLSPFHHLGGMFAYIHLRRSA